MINTPTYGSWLNLLERWFSALTTKKLQRSTHRSVELAADIQSWVQQWNQNPTPFTGHKTAEEILERLAGSAPPSTRTPPHNTTQFTALQLSGHLLEGSRSRAGCATHQQRSRREPVLVLVGE